MTNKNSVLTMNVSTRIRRTAPGHPVKYLLHRSCFDLGPNYRNYADWKFDKPKSLYRKNLLAHFGCVNAIEFSKDGNLLVSGGDDRRVLLWNVDRAIVSKEEPTVMQAEHLSNVFSLDFNCSSEKIFSAGNDDQVIVHDIATSAPLDYFVHEQPVYGISADPVNESVFCSACDDGRILIFDIRESGNDPFCLAKASSAFHSVMFHPVEPRLLVTANSKEGVCSWDVRMPKRVFVKYGMQNSNQCCMSARFNRLGSQILVLRRRLPPILYSTDSSSHLYQFNHRGYYNSCTMKSCSFAGMNDQYVLSGSDNFDLHLWKIPTPGSDQWVNKADMVLRGHRSIVNQVRFNYTHNLIASSGVEKIVKLWSPFPLPDELGGKSAATVVNESERRIYTPDDYVSLVMQAGQGQFMSLTYEAGRKTTREDSRMLAFFDALVQRDINGISDEESDNFPESSYTNTVYSSPETSSSGNADEDSNPPNFRSLLSVDATSNLLHRNSEDHTTREENSSSRSSLTINDGINQTNQDPINSEDSVDANANASTHEVINDHEAEALIIDDVAQPTEDRDMTANMITQLILKKESSRRKMHSSSKTTTGTIGTRILSSNHDGPSGTDSESDQSSNDDLNSNTSSTSRNSSSRPLNVSISGRRQDRRRSATSNSYSTSRKEFRKRLLRERRRELLSTPVYESSRNSTDNQAALSVSTSETNYDRINELMTRTTTGPLSDSSVNSSSSSSSSDSSSSEEANSCKEELLLSKKIMKLSKKSRAIISSDSSSSDSEEATSDRKSSSTSVKVDESNSSHDSIMKGLKRKRRHPCKLQALFKRCINPEASSPRPDEESVSYKRLRSQIMESASTSSAEFTNVETVAFKKFAKQKDRNYRKASSSISLSTPPDSGIDVSKEREQPCCSKSFTGKDSTKSVSLEKIEKLPQTSKHKKEAEESESSVNPTDDLGYGRIDSDEESD